MKGNSFTLIFLAVLAILVFTPLTNAAVQVVYTTWTASHVRGEQGTFTVDVKNTGSAVTTTLVFADIPGIITWSSPIPSVYLGSQETHRFTTTFILGPEAKRNVQSNIVVRTAPVDDSPTVIPISLIFPNLPSDSSSSVAPISPNPQSPSTAPSGSSGKGQTSFCSLGSKGTNLTIEKAKLKSTGSKTKWLAGDTVDLQVEIANKGSNTLNDVVIEMGLRDSRGVNNVRELTFKGEEDYRRDLGNLRSDDEEDTTFTFTVPASLDEGDYRLVLKAYVRGQESSVCTEQVSDFSEIVYQIIEVEREDDEGKFIRFDEISLIPTVVACGDQVQLTAHVTNIGDEDQNRVNVLLKSAKLGLNVAKEISSGLDEGDDTSITLSFNVPRDAAAGIYNLELNAEYDYKNGNYQMRSEIPNYISLPLALCRSKITDDTQQSTTLKLFISKPESQKAAFLPSSLFSTQNWILGIGSLVILLLIVIVALTRSISGSTHLKHSDSKTLYS